MRVLIYRLIFLLINLRLASSFGLSSDFATNMLAESRPCHNIDIHDQINNKDLCVSNANSSNISDFYLYPQDNSKFATSDANQDSMKTPLSEMKSQTDTQLLIRNLSVPIQTGKDSNLNITPQQIEFKIKY